MEKVEVSTEFCRYCEQEQVVNFKFCSNCGKQSSKKLESSTRQEEYFQGNLNRLGLYTLLTIGILILSSFSDDTFINFLFLTITFAIIDLVFSLIQPSVWQLVLPRKIRLLPMLSIIAIGVSSGIMVSYSMDYINILLFGETSGNIYLFEHLENPVWVAILFIAIFPAFFEELAFRGFLFRNLKVIGGERSAVFGSTFLFALVHLSFLSFIWIIPFGLILVYFRKKYSTLLYGMVGHFIHNTVVVLVEYYDLFT